MRYSGAEANVAVSLANYGIESYIVSSVPDTEIGQACINHIRQYAVNTEYVKRQGKRLGIFYLESDASQRPSKVIYDRAGSSITELQVGDINWDEIFEGKDWFHFTGITPAYGLLCGLSSQESIELAVAASCLKHSIHGDFNLVCLDEVMTLLRGDASGRVRR